VPYADPDPRRRVDHLEQEPAGEADHAALRLAGVGVLRAELPAGSAVVVAGANRGREACDRLGQGARGGVRRRPGIHRGDGRLGRRAPLRAGGAHSQ
jgi:hypothetical protein